MTLVTEDGTGLANAEAFATVVQFKAYCDARGISYASITPDTAIEQALRKGADYMEQVYRERWGGMLTTTTQALGWPRSLVEMRDAPGLYPGIQSYYYPDNTVPTQVRNANIELAVRAASADLLGDLEQGIASETVGPITTVYDKGTPQSKRYPAIDRMLAPLLQGGGGIRLVRG